MIAKGLDMNEWEQKQLDKADRYETKAGKASKTGEAILEQVKKESDMIPLGQPILVGHHSEGRHRRHLASMDSRRHKGLEEHGKAEHYADKAERIRDNIENNTVISSDDPDAIPKLQAKVESLEEERIKFKEHNKFARKAGTDQLPKYILTNLGANIRSVKQRIEQLEFKANIDTTEQEVNGITITKDLEDNRIRLHFPGKPKDEIRTLLKAHGFRWSYSNDAWQRQLNSAGIYAVAQVLIKIEELED